MREHRDRRPLGPALLLACAAMVATAGAPAMAQSSSARKPEAAREDFPISLRAGLGFTASPETFLMTFEAPVELRDYWSVGPLLQLGVADRRLIVAPTFNSQWGIHPFSEGGLRELRAFVQAGLGFAYLEHDHRPGANDDFGFLMDMGAGFEHPISDHLTIGSNVLFNVLPDATLGDNLIVSFQLVTLRVRF